MGLLTTFISLLSLWRPAFSKKQLYQRARALGIGFLGSIGKKTLANVSIFLNHHKKGYEANCAVFSRRKWKAEKLFDPLLKEALSFTSGRYIAVAADDTKVKKTGKKIKKARWLKDPKSPPFHINFMWGLRFLQLSLLIDASTKVPSRAIPIDFMEAVALKKPRKKATAEEQKAYKEAKKFYNLSTLFVLSAKRLRDRLNSLGETRKVLFVNDASFCNRTCLQQPIEGVEMCMRCKKNAKLCFAYKGSNKRKKYADKKFTPEQVRQNNKIPWKLMIGHYGGKFRRVRYKEISNVLWQGGSRTRPLKLVVIAPTPYKKTKNGKPHYTQPAYLLCTDINADAKEVIQYYLNRWQIEVNHREEKSLIGLGEAQVRNNNSVERQPIFHVAVYSALLVAARKTYQDRSQQDSDEPSWRRKKPKRLTCRAMLGIMRAEIINSPEVLQEIDITTIEIATLLKKAA